MPIRLADNAIEELERSREPQQANWWTWHKMYPSETNGSGMLPGFEKELKDWIVQPGYENVYVIRAEDIPLQITVEKSAEWATGAQPEQEKFITGYYVFPVTQPVGAVSISQKVAIIGNVPIGWQVPSLGVTPRVNFGLRGGLVPDWAQRLKEFSQLTEGWDSYGARPISGTAIERAKAVILDAVSEQIGLPEPFVAPTSAGGVGLEWEVESGKELLLEISPAGELSYLLVTSRPDGGEIEIEDVIDSSAELHKLFSSLSE